MREWDEYKQGMREFREFGDAVVEKLEALNAQNAAQEQNIKEQASWIDAQGKRLIRLENEIKLHADAAARGPEEKQRQPVPPDYTEDYHRVGGRGSKIMRVIRGQGNITVVAENILWLDLIPANDPNSTSHAILFFCGGPTGQILAAYNDKETAGSHFDNLRVWLCDRESTRTYYIMPEENRPKISIASSIPPVLKL